MCHKKNDKVFYKWLGMSDAGSFVCNRKEYEAGVSAVCAICGKPFEQREWPVNRNSPDEPVTKYAIGFNVMASVSDVGINAQVCSEVCIKACELAYEVGQRNGGVEKFDEMQIKALSGKAFATLCSDYVNGCSHKADEFAAQVMREHRSLQDLMFKFFVVGILTALRIEWKAGLAGCDIRNKYVCEQANKMLADGEFNYVEPRVLAAIQKLSY